MRGSAAWPGLETTREAGHELRYERGVWGKAHGARSDFRWLARSSGFASELRYPERELNLGSEDRAIRACYWRTLGARCFAVTGYPSRAVDAAGRGGFLEKQVLEWQRGDLPAALGALLLLARSEEFGDHVWWERRDEPGWDEDGFSLAIDPSQCRPVPWSEGVLLDAVETGRAQLALRCDPDSLARAYAALLAERPAFVEGLEEPLDPQALAALLLPLPREHSDRLSLAAWLPSSRTNPGELARRWQIVALPEAPRGWRDTAGDLPRGHAEQIVQALLEAGPQALPEPSATRPTAVHAVPGVARAGREGAAQARRETVLTPPSANPPAWLEEVHDFARRQERRWLPRSRLREQIGHSPRPISETDARALLSWPEEVAAQRPAHADPRQWAVKVDLLRAIGLVFAPADHAFERVGRFTSDRVAPLMFAPLLAKDRRGALQALGSAPLGILAAESARFAIGDEELSSFLAELPAELTPRA